MTPSKKSSVLNKYFSKTRIFKSNINKVVVTKYSNKNTSNNKNERKYKRVWSKYNSSLVKRIEILLDLSFLETWEKDLERENNGKIGRPYEYPMEFFIFLSKIRFLWGLSFRELEAFVREISERTKKFRPMSYVSIFKRIREIPIENMVNEINKLS